MIEAKRSHFTAKIRQQPLRGRMCGTKAIVDKRILDPPLVVQMVFDDPAQEKLYFSNTNFLVCHVTLYSSNGEQVAAFIQHEKTGSKVVQKVLLGDDPVTARILNDPEDNKPHLFFVLSSLSIRYTGFYSLRCTVIDIQGLESQSMMTKPFQVYSSKSYPGMLDSTAISRSFSHQGIPMYVGFKKTYNT